MAMTDDEKREKRRLYRKKISKQRREYTRAWRAKYPEKYKAQMARWRKTHRKNQWAQLVLWRAKQSGKVKVSTVCQLCWDIGQKLQGHHTDYDKPLEVIWLCRGCHAVVDRHKISPRNK